LAAVQSARSFVQVGDVKDQTFGSRDDELDSRKAGGQTIELIKNATVTLSNMETPFFFMPLGSP
jgi:hypothetical protein